MKILVAKIGNAWLIGQADVTRLDDEGSLTIENPAELQILTGQVPGRVAGAAQFDTMFYVFLLPMPSLKVLMSTLREGAYQEMETIPYNGEPQAVAVRLYLEALKANKEVPSRR